MNAEGGSAISVNVEGNTQVILAGSLGSSATVTASGHSVIDLGEFSELAPSDIPLTGGGWIVALNGGTVVALGANPNFAGTVTVGGGTVKIETADSGALGTGTLVLNGGLLQNTVAGDGSGLSNPLAIQASTTISAGTELEFLGTVTVQSSATLTVTGLVQFDKALTAAASTTPVLTLTGASPSYVNVESGSAISVNVEGNTQVILAGSLGSSATVTAGGHSVIDLGEFSELAPSDIPLTGGGWIVALNGGTVVDLGANPNFAGTVTVGGGTVKIETADSGRWAPAQ